MNDEMLEFVEKERNERFKKERAIYSELQERESELSKYREMLRAREQEFEHHRERLKQDQLERENFFRQELNERDKLIEQREKELFSREGANKSLI